MLPWHHVCIKCQQGERMAHQYHFPLLVPHRLGRVGGGFLFKFSQTCPMGAGQNCMTIQDCELSWSTGVLEYWSVGKNENPHFNLNFSFHYSITPPLHNSSRPPQGGKTFEAPSRGSSKLGPFMSSRVSPFPLHVLFACCNLPSLPADRP